MTGTAVIPSYSVTMGSSGTSVPASAHTFASSNDHSSDTGSVTVTGSSASTGSSAASMT